MRLPLITCLVQLIRAGRTPNSRARSTLEIGSCPTAAISARSAQVAPRTTLRSCGADSQYRGSSADAGRRSCRAAVAISGSHDTPRWHRVPPEDDAEAVRWVRRRCAMQLANAAAQIQPRGHVRTTVPSAGVIAQVFRRSPSPSRWSIGTSHSSSGIPRQLLPAAACSPDLGVIVRHPARVCRVQDDVCQLRFAAKLDTALVAPSQGRSPRASRFPFPRAHVRHHGGR